MLDDVAGRIANLPPEKQRILLDRLIARQAASRATSAEYAPLTGDIPLTPGRVYGLWDWLTDSTGRVHPVHDLQINNRYLAQASHTLHSSIAESAVRHLMQHHDALRLRITQEGAFLKQYITAPDDAVPFLYFDFSKLAHAEQGQAIEKTITSIEPLLDVSHGPVLCAIMFDLGPNNPGRLLFTVSHAVCDGFSWGILMEDFIRAYTQVSQGKAVTLPIKTTSIKEYAERKMEYGQSDILQQDLAAWRSLPWDQVVSLPVDFPEGRSEKPVGSLRSIYLSLSIEDTHTILRELPTSTNLPVMSILLTALVDAFAAWTGSPAVALNWVHHGRSSPFSDIDLSRTIGNLAFPVPLALTLDGGYSGMRALEQVGQQLKRLPKHSFFAEFIPDSCLQVPEVIVNFQAAPPDIAHTGSWLEPATESIGPGVDFERNSWGLIYFWLRTIRGKLELECQYSANVYRPVTIESLAHSYLRSLKALSL